MPGIVERMIQNGFDELALMTTTEQREKVDGMEKPLKVLAKSKKLHIAKVAIEHLEIFYQ